MRKRRPLERKSNPLRDASIIVIASEDCYAVSQYFEFFKSTRIQFRILATEDCKSNPKELLTRLDRDLADFDFGEGDSFWLVADTDHWIEPNHIQNLVEVVQACKQKGYRVALSNPCFDLWLYLHFAPFPTEDQLTCKEIGEKLKVVLGGFNKTNVYQLPFDFDCVETATQRAKEKMDNQLLIPTRPQTAIHLILDDLIQRRIFTVRMPLDEKGKPKKKTKR